jgi:hypothetical protein
MIQGTIGMIQGTISMIQGTIGMIQGTIGMIQGTKCLDSKSGSDACGTLVLYMAQALHDNNN